MIVVETTLRSIFSQLPDVTINGDVYPETLIGVLKKIAILGLPLLAKPATTTH